MGRPFEKAISYACWLSRAVAQQQKLPKGRRWIQISTTPHGASPSTEKFSPDLPGANNAESPDAKFEVLGAPYSLLSASLSASQILYTRRGTLVGVSGKAENAISTLSMLEPFRRALLGIPFLYQKISSASPVTAFISTRSPITSFAVVHLNGTIDWIVAQRRALLAWTGHTLSITPTLNKQMSLAHWGDSQVTGRGLLALVGSGQIYEVVLRDEEEYLAHPSNVVAYTLTQHPPLPYRLRSSALRLQIPGIKLGSILPDTKFFRVMQQSGTWKAVRNFFFTLRTWSRRTIWGDRLFLQFHGPVTILLQSRASRLNDVLTNRDVNEIADTPAGAVQEAITLAVKRPAGGEAEGPKSSTPLSTKATRLSVATIASDGKVKFKETSDFKSLSN